MEELRAPLNPLKLEQGSKQTETLIKKNKFQLRTNEEMNTNRGKE